MKIWILATSVSLTAIAGCTPPKPVRPDPPSAQLVTAEKSYIEDSLNSVKNSLKDPDSAKFYGIYATQKPNQTKPNICGYVNAKNSYGGYTGKKPFLATPGHVSLWGDVVIGGRSVASDVIIGNCTLAFGQPAKPSQDIEYRW